MSSTRRASKRARIQRRAENDQMRTARRDSLAVLLSRAQRGVPLTVDEAALLRAAVEAEVREGDAARQAERGQQRAADRERERATAAEAAIVEAEADAERFKADYLSACQTIATMHEAATGKAGEGPVRGVVEDVADVRARLLAAEQRAAQAEERAEVIAADRDRLAAELDDAEQRLAAQHDAHDARRRTFADALGVDDTTTWPRLLDIARTTAHLAQRAANTEAGDTAALRLAERTARQWKARAQEAEEQAAQQCARANAWRGHAIETDDRADRHHAAWRNARKRAAERTAQRDRAEQALATAREERARALALAAARGDALAAHLAATEPTR
ncbi:hypothetical protein [Streptomyces pseudogriseolus]|uniref:hypothetical protein n=1 Tax=Streptomyces pseudogriseolus TaxID=36817 RepID=UPI003FA2AD9F